MAAPVYGKSPLAQADQWLQSAAATGASAGVADKSGEQHLCGHGPGYPPRNPGVQNRMKGMALCQSLYYDVGIKADNHPLRNCVRASRII